MSGEIYSYLFPLLFKAGAKDVYLTNLIMKKNRPAQKLSVLCTQPKAEQLKKIIFQETTTLGIRQFKVERSSLARKIISFKSSLGNVNIKAAFYEGEMLKFSPEYEDCQNLARKNNLPLRKVYQIIKQEAAVQL